MIPELTFLNTMLQLSLKSARIHYEISPLLFHVTLHDLKRQAEPRSLPPLTNDLKQTIK